MKENLTQYLARHRAEILEAAIRIGPYTRRTPTLVVDADGLVVKPESLQVTGTFKARGAFNAILRIVEREPAVRGVVTISSGNHARAVAHAARTVGIPAVILIPEDANPAKVAATRALGAEVIQDGVTFLNREQRLEQVIDERGLTLVHPFDDWDVIHGQATAALELFQDRPDIAMVVAPVSGGGLIAGTALAAKAARPDVLVIGVEPKGGDDAAQSLRDGRLRRLPSPPTTIADGARSLTIGQRNFEVMIERGLVDEIVTVDEDEIGAAAVVSWLEHKIAAEPTAALPLAAYRSRKLPAARVDGPTALVVSGGNVDPAVLATLLLH
jgi:threonine dehydratase